MKKTLFATLFLMLLIPVCFAQKVEKAEYQTLSFGEGGQVKMIYDRRHHPQAVFLNNKVFFVYNGGAQKNTENNEKTYPFVISYNPKTTLFSSPVKLGEKGSKDHHYCPVIWADNNNFLHVLHGNHSTAGTHLISKKKADIGKSADDWSVASQVRSSLSYPTVYNIYNNKKLMYFRTGEHRSAWT